MAVSGDGVALGVFSGTVIGKIIEKFVTSSERKVLLSQVLVLPSGPMR